MRLTIAPLHVLIALASAAILYAIPQNALAADYCVARSGCDAGLSYPATGLQAALDAAAATPDNDRILLGPGHFAGAEYLAAKSGSIEIAGAGAQQTVFDSGFGGLAVVSNYASVHDVGFDLTAGLAFGLETNGIVSNISVTSTSASSNQEGIAVGDGAAIDHATITRPGGTGIDVRGGATVVDSTIEVGSDGAISRGIALDAPQIDTPVDLRRLHVRATNPLLVDVGHVRIADFLLDLGNAPGAVGISARSLVNGPSVQVQADRLTIVGHKDMAAMQTGVRADTNVTGAVIGLTLNDSVIAGVGYSSVRTASDGYTYLALHHSLVTPGELTLDQNSGAGAGAFENDVVSTADPRFVDAGAGDYRPRFDSPLLDAAGPATIALSSTDLAGASRLVDGNGDGSTLSDIGAYEYQRRAPVVTGASTGPSTLVAGVPVAFVGAATDADPTEAPAGVWRFDDGTSANGLSASHVYAVAGTHARRSPSSTPPAWRLRARSRSSCPRRLPSAQ